MSGAHAQIVTAAEAGYPRRLRGAPAAPPSLHVRGSIVDRDLAIALVGARAADRAALDTARRLGREIAARGGLVVSGGAIGVDGAAHRGALDGGGPTVAVLGCGIDVVYPLRHRALYEEMVAGGGALVSPFPPGTPPRAFHFVRRNAIIAALADAVVVVAATGNSGSLHTARAAAALGRPVCAVPGTDGCERLLATGAAVVESAEDIARAVAGEPRRRAAPAPGGQAAGLLAALDPRDPRDEEQLSVLTGLSLREVAGLLCDLELQGLAILLPGGNYVRSPLAPATESRS